MTNPLPANAHANAAVTQRELSFDALVAEFGQPEYEQRPESRVKPVREPKAAPTREAKAAPTREPKPAGGTQQARKPRRAALRIPGVETLKLLGLVVVVVISSTLAAVALTR
ncbi:hypothetical protein [Agreia sp. COWG]|uniref:hypothetical protein n=1 Tax=Agreia sp. COWG TaxID=2773266 RepID=UPI00192807B4|nr:hypothetical protein [Agreia sp. COWG]